MSFTTNISSSSRPSFVSSKTMPAFRRALSLPSVDRSLASLRASSSKGIRRMSSFGRSSTSNYTAPTAAPAAISISPLTRPSFKRAMTMPAPIRTLRRIPTLKESCTSVASTSSISSVTSSSTASSASTRRSIESFSSTEKHVTLALQLRALPSTVTGVLTVSFHSAMSLSIAHISQSNKVRIILLLSPPQNVLISVFYRTKSPATPPSVHAFLASLARIVKTYQCTIRRAARAQRKTIPQASLSAFFAPTPKRVRAEIPAPVDLKTLTADIPRVVYYSPVALPLPKGPAPAVLPARRTRRLSVLPTVKEESVEGALCAGW
ncbi:hypothetical protein B0H14DRAFT_2741295 [Mycena olivaceomarginata]|nr:hypothetical protein B0H14DRAFT_2741295 [Mycena olivaceomarginata]